MLKKVLLISFGLILGFIIYIYFSSNKIQQIIPQITSNPLDISYLVDRNYIGSDIKIENSLSDGSNYKRYIASYYSDGLKIYALLTIPNSNPPSDGFPAIIFNHGYITPERYTPDGNYIAYVDAIAKEGYIVFKPDYRGNGKSQGTPGSEYFSRNYDIDNLNAIASIKKYNLVNPAKIGVWGHSLGGHVTLMDLLTSKDIKAAVIWGGVVGSYNDIIYNWQSRVRYQPDKEDLTLRNLGSKNLISKHGSPSQNPTFWNSIDPVSNLNLVSAPVQIHVGLSDEQVPSDFSISLYSKLITAGKNVELYKYTGADHNISQFFSLAMSRSISFFDKYLK